jgi:hypothetical protein
MAEGMAADVLGEMARWAARWTAFWRALRLT